MPNQPFGCFSPGSERRRPCRALAPGMLLRCWLLVLRGDVTLCVLRQPQLAEGDGGGVARRPLRRPTP
eukprot:2756122-Prorocentrum_lima.AAC.1